MSKRVFIGIKASKLLQNKVSNWQNKHKQLRVRFIKPKNLHLTLMPPWYEDDIKLPIEKVKQIRFQRFEIDFDKVYINFKNQVIWAESSKPPKQIINLAQELKTIFPEKNPRPFKAHMTIARFKDGKILEKLSFEKINWKERISKVVLFESVLGRKEANYKVLN